MTQQLPVADVSGGTSAPEVPVSSVALNDSVDKPEAAERPNAVALPRMPSPFKPDAVIKIPPGSAAFSVEMKRRLQHVADELSKDGRASVRLLGYVPEGGSSAWNLGEAERPVRLVKQALEGLGVAPRKIQTASFGDEHKSIWQRKREWVEVFIIQPGRPALMK